MHGAFETGLAKRGWAVWARVTLRATPKADGLFATSQGDIETSRQ